MPSDSGRDYGCSASIPERLVGMYAAWNRCGPYPQPVASNELVEVTRLLFRGAKWKEGFSSGWMQPTAKRIPYGCWFFFAPGSGIYLNVTSTIAVRSRYELDRLWGLPERPHILGLHDAYLCSEAKARGYTTIQISSRAGLEVDVSRRWGDWSDSEHMTPPEILLCDSDCMSKESTDACVTGSALWTADSAGDLRRCDCDQDSPLLSCAPGERHDPCSHTLGGARRSANSTRREAEQTQQ